MKTFLISLCSFFTLLASSQSKLGDTWVTGSGGVKIRFQGNNITTSKTIFYPTYFNDGNSNICDTNGNLLLCSDGYNIYDSNANFIDEGDTLVPFDLYCHYNGWSPLSQTSIFLPMDSGIYYFVTPTFSDVQFADCLGNNQCFFDLLLYNVVDMKANGGGGKVVKRMQTLMQNAKLSKVQMMACRHSNGKDWWLLKQAQDSNIVYKFLFTQDSVYNYGFQKFNAPVWGIPDVIGQSVFRKDGSKYATVVLGDTVPGRIFMSDFDRCYGILSVPKILQAPIASAHSINDTTLLDKAFSALAFSPDGSKLYAIALRNIFQYDLDDDTWFHVAGLDTNWVQFQLYSAPYLGPDSKLYIGNWGGTSRQMSVIYNPDIKGAGCNFCPRCLRLDSLGISISAGTPPCMPNYSLGAQDCWPLNLTPNPSPEGEGSLHVYPNPAHTKFQINTKIPRLSAGQANAKKELYNSVGQLIFSTIANEIEVSAFSKGIYYLKVGNAVRKVVID